MNSKEENIKKLWANKSTSEIILVMYSLIENTDWSEVYKKRIHSVMKGIITYTDRGDKLLAHHRDYLKENWDRAWKHQKDNSVKQEIKEWLLSKD